MYKKHNKYATKRIFFSIKKYRKHVICLFFYSTNTTSLIQLHIIYITVIALSFLTFPKKSRAISLSFSQSTIR